ncbi:MAG: hypothetical protein KAJ63_12070 [Methyloprofundus sp.]|nr:hypothetical protein [Methyloprofundus sp.]
MKLVSLIVFALVGGYAFSTTWTPSLYHAARESGHRLYLRVVFYTVFLLLFSLFTHVLLFINSQNYIDFIEFISVFVGDVSFEEPSIFSQPSKIAILILSFILGPTLGHLLNFPKWAFITNFYLPIIKIRPFFLYEKKLLQHAIKNNDFEKLIARSVYDNFPILFTLESGKVYVGWAVSAPNPVQERKSIRILPIISGYRDKDTQKVKFTTDYYPVLNKFSNSEETNHEVEDLEVVIPAGELSSCRLFDISIYNEHFVGSDSQ